MRRSLFSSWAPVALARYEHSPTAPDISGRTLDSYAQVYYRSVTHDQHGDLEVKGVRKRFSTASFLQGAAALGQLPADEGAEVAFAGRSNAGKSSAINAITASKSLARISKTPGRTREINFFRLDDTHRFVDLPGYGYARVPKALKARWGALIEGYLKERGSLRGVVIIMDVRRPFTALDEQLVEWCRSASLAVHVLLTKADKLSRGRAAQALVSAKGHSSSEQVTLQLFSATRSIGLEEVHQRLAEWLWHE